MGGHWSSGSVKRKIETRFLRGSSVSLKRTVDVEYDRPVKVFDFFSGCGGASCGFRNAGMEIVFALDCDDDAKESFESNFPDARFEHLDIRDMPVADVRDLVAQYRPAPILFLRMRSMSALHKAENYAASAG